MAWCLFAGAVLGTLATNSHAATLVGEDTQVLPNDTNITLNLPKFDPSTGTLSNVWVQVELRLNNAQVQLDNDAASAQNGTARVLNTANSLTSSVTLLKSNFDTINNGDLSINNSQVYSLGATSGDPVGQFNATLAGDYANYVPGTLTSGDFGDIFNGVWGGYQGTGNFTITTNATYLTSATFVGNDGFFQGNTPNGEIYGKVVYTYTPTVVPEPGTLALLAIGSVVTMYRRKKKS